MDVQAIYDELAAGTVGPVDLSWTRRKLQLLALERAKAGTPAERAGALRVAAVLGRRDGIAIVQELVRDPDPEVRRTAFRQAVEAHEVGLVALRDAAGGADPDLASEALDRLVQWVDQAGLPTARRALGHPHARVRERAARLLGHVGGPAVRVDLERHAADPDPSVREAVAEALDRLAGRIPRGRRTSWWTEEGQTLPVTLADPPGATAPAWGPDATPLLAPSPEPALPSAPWRRVEVPEPEAEPPPWDGRSVSLPAQLPTETRALVRLLGSVAPEDRPAVLSPLADSSHAAPWSSLLQDHLAARASAPAGALDPALTVGLLLAASLHGGPAHVSPIRGLLRDASPTVRAACAAALGSLGAASLVPSLAGLLSDAAPEVRLAAVAALAALGRRTGRLDLARDALGRARTDASLRDAIDRALEGG